MKLIKISDTHYIIVDDSPIQNGMFCYYKHPMHKDNGMVTKVLDKKYSDFAPYGVRHEEGYGVIEGYKKITHSTQPLEPSLSSVSALSTEKSFVFIKPLDLSEVKELIGEVDVEEKARTFAKNHSIYDTAQDDTEYGYKNGYNQAIEDNKDKRYTDEDIQNAWIMGYRGDTFDEMVDYFKRPKTEWDVEFVDGKLKLKQ